MLLTDYFRSEKDLTWDLAKQCGVNHGVIRLPETKKFDFNDKAHWQTVYDGFVNYLLSSNIENLICMPTTGHKIANELIKLNCNKNIYLVDTLEQAVKKAKLVTEKNTICLMSPAAASYEYFKNFEEKGTAYKKLIKDIN